MSAEDLSPFGTETQKYWNRRHEYFVRFDEGIETDAEGLYSVMPEHAALDQASRIASHRVLDAFAGVGGNAIGFARAGKEVRAIESDPGRFRMAVNNARVYGVEDQIEFVLGDALDHLEDFGEGAVYLDPPWGGPDYKGQGAFLLEFFSPHGQLLLNRTLPRFSEVALRVPRSFDLAELAGAPRPWKVLDDVSFGRTVSRTVYFH